jgi:cytoskeletal protein RodZ
MRELSLRTKIGIKYLKAIEAVDPLTLPRPVYLRGYLREIAQVFQLDESDLIRRYFLYLGYP